MSFNNVYYNNLDYNIIDNIIKPFSQKEINKALPPKINNIIKYSYMDCNQNCQDRSTYACSPQMVLKNTK